MQTVIIPIIRAGVAADLGAIAAIQRQAPEAAQWNTREYLTHELRVAVCENQIAGFLVSRPTSPSIDGSEWELLNLAVSPEFRRKGIARALVESLMTAIHGPIFLEVRASNSTAICFYNSIGFQEVGRRPAYYESPPEAAIVMKFHSC